MKTYVIITDEGNSILGKTCEAESLQEASQKLNPDNDSRINIIGLSLLDKDLIKIAEEPGFKFICKKCGSENCEFRDSLEMGSSQTGLMGSAEIVCKDCGQQLTLIS
jgi:DNA-directed RNA polymerase subunit RPC12/RpoP